LFVAGCGVAHESAKKAAPVALITTPAAYYSSPKAKFLGAKYKDNLDRLVERIIRDSKTSTLQFANNIASVGGIGFFTHSATTLSDERFLEVVLAAPDAFETKGDYSPKLFRLFGSYGAELLSILSSDTAIYEDRDVSGYGLNFSWRSLGGEPGRVTVERAVVYLPKDRVRAFLRRELTQNHLLAEAVIFAGQESGPMSLVSYRAQNAQPDFRPPIQDETLAVAAVQRQDPEPQTKKPKATPFKDDHKPPLDKPAAQPPPIASEKKPPVSKPASAHGSESGALAVKPPAKMAAEAQAASAERSQPQPPKAPQPTASAIPGIVDVKPLEGQTAVAVNKPGPGAQPNKTEPVSTVSNKSPAAQPLTMASERKPPVSQPSAAHGSEPGAGVAKPPAKTAAEAQRNAAVQSQPQSAKEPQRKAAPPPPPVADTKPVESQTAPAASKAVPASQPNKAETVSTVSKKPPTAQSVASAAPPAQREKISEVNVKQEKAASAGKPIEGGGTKTAMKAEAAEKIAQTDPPRPQTQLAAPKAASEQLALVQKKPAETAANSKTAAGSRTALLGYVIQVVFDDKSDAQRWAEAIARRGHAVSLTETGGASFRLRLGNFPLREEAERQLRALKEEGLTGVILNLPQAYHPDAGKTATIVKPTDTAAGK
jgi:hypothetical protein